jgi:hypothetical protein
MRAIRCEARHSARSSPTPLSLTALASPLFTITSSSRHQDTHTHTPFSGSGQAAGSLAPEITRSRTLRAAHALWLWFHSGDIPHAGTSLTNTHQSRSVTHGESTYQRDCIRISHMPRSTV